MKRLALLALASSSLFAQSPAPSATPAGSATSPLEGLSAPDVEQALSFLKSNYAQPEALSDAELSRATLRGLLERLAPGVELIATANAKVEASPFRSEIMSGSIGYLRMGDLAKNNLGELDAALKKFGESAVKSIVLDLRATPASSDYELAAEVIRRFCGKGKPLFTLKKSASKPERVFTSNMDPAFDGLLVVLVGDDTAGAGEVIAAALRTQARALVVGEKTSGRAAEFSDLPLHDGTVLRVAVAEISLPDIAQIYPGGLKPDISVPMGEVSQREVLRAELEHGVTPLVTETERARLNEAALVAGKNPDIDAAEAAQKNKGKAAVPLHDPQLQRALDLVTTIRVYDKTHTEKQP